MLPYDQLKKIVYGGDYNPEQWDEATWEEDMRLFKLAGIDILTLNVFSWAAIQPSEDTYDFDRLDRIMELVRKNGMKVCMATSTGAHPAWMAKRHPDILRVDFEGRKRKFGGRHNSCPNSPTYRTYAPRLAEKLAERYKEYDNIVVWHIANEFGGECYCENCEKAFRGWLKEKYQTIDKLNQVWDTAFWGHTFYDWDEVVVPNALSEHFAEDLTMFQGISLDYRRFNSDSILDCYRLEYDAIKRVQPDASITTNLMGFFKGLDYQKWAKYMDFISWDNYPQIDDSYARIAMSHDLMRGISHGEPFALMEQTPSVTNWHQYNALKRPGVMRLWSYQAVAHGADTVMFFQMRRSIGACEKYHGAVIDHVGNENTRVFREISALGEELEKLGSRTLGARTKTKIALMMTWDNWWALEYSAGPSRDLKYITEFTRYYEALRNMNYDVDIIAPQDDLSGYEVVIAPLLYMVREGEDENIRQFVKRGGTFVTSFFSGIVQENDLVITGGYPGKLRDILGIWVEEQDALPRNAKNSFIYKGKEYPAFLLCDLLHLEGARQIDASGYGSDFYQGSPVITEHKLGDGKAYYVATATDEAFYRVFLKELCNVKGILPVMDTPEGVEAASRENEKERFIFLLNHTNETKTVDLPWKGTEIISEQPAEKQLVLDAHDVKIVAVSKS